MNGRRSCFQLCGLLLLVCCISFAQTRTAAMPDSLVIARDTFWDVGPPFDYYDLIQITKTRGGLSLDQVLVTPHGQACLRPASVEERSVVLHKTMAELLEGRNPCAIPEKDLRREMKRCKRCLVFSGVRVMMQASCGGTTRQLDVDILDRDIYDSRTPTPENTSWSMRVLSTLSDALGPGSEAQPIFQMGVAAHHEVPRTPLVNAMREGRYDDLFGKDSGVSKIVVEAGQPPPPPPSVEIAAITPSSAATPEVPIYPPIAIAAHVEGEVTVSFKVGADGRAQNISIIDGPEMLQLAVKDAVPAGDFPNQIAGKPAGRQFASI